MRGAAIARRHAAQAAICDVAEPWAHGTLLRATAFPTYWDYNALLVEGPVPVELDATALAAEADRRLAGLAHRKAEIEDEHSGAPLAAGLRDLGWHVERLVWMRRDGDAPTKAPPEALAELPEPAVAELRAQWLLEERVMTDEAAVEAFVREESVARERLPGEVVALGVPGTAYVTLRIDGDVAGEVEDAYVVPGARGRGLGTGLLHAAVERAEQAGVRDLWILADADGRPRELYARLGFRPVWTLWDCVRRPG